MKSVSPSLLYPVNVQQSMSCTLVVLSSNTCQCKEPENNKPRSHLKYLLTYSLAAAAFSVEFKSWAR